MTYATNSMSSMNNPARAGLPIVALLLLLGASAWAGEQPKLVLQITVDALRGDLPGRYSGVLGDGGFNT